jgi:Malectin domain/Bacterial Ig-like domain
MNATTITATSFTLTPAGGTPVAATVAYDATTKTATLTPTNVLTASTTYTAKLDTTIKATDGSTLAAAVTWSFTTTTAPEAVTYSPANYSTGMNTWPGKTTVTMDMPINASTLTTATVTLKKADGTQLGATPTLDATTNTISLTPSVPLPLGTTLTETLTTGVQSSTGIPLAAPISWSFTTATSGQAVRVNAGGAAYTGGGTSWLADQYFRNGTAISTTAAIGGTTDGPLYQAQRVGNSTGDPAYTLPASNGTYTVNLYFAEIQKTGAGQRNFNVDVSGTTPNPDIAGLDIYAAAGGANKALVKTVTGATVCGSALKITTTNGTADFPAIAAVEIIPTGPAVCGTTPANAATAVARTTAVTAGFSGGMDATTINGSSVTLWAGTTQVAATVSYSATTQKVTLTPSATLAASTTYTVKLAGTIMSSGGQALPAYSWTFTTGTT